MHFKIATFHISHEHLKCSYLRKVHSQSQDIDFVSFSMHKINENASTSCTFVHTTIEMEMIATECLPVKFSTLTHIHNDKCCLEKGKYMSYVDAFVQRNSFTLRFSVSISLNSKLHFDFVQFVLFIWRIELTV